VTFEPYRYERPTDPREACRLLAEPGAVALAGGTDLLLQMRLRERKPAVVVDLKHLAALRGIHRVGDRLKIGALATVTDVLHDPALGHGFGCLVDAARVFACAEIRHRATVGGNLANASPGAEFAVPLVALDAEIALTDGQGCDRRLPIGEFLLGPGRTALRPGELITAISVPVGSGELRSAYRRRARTRGMDLASVSLAVVVHHAGDPPTRRIALSMGAVAPVPPRPDSTEALLSGGPIGEARLAAARRDLVDGLAPRAGSLRATPDYKLAVLPTMLERTLRELGVVEP
jgi:CO/xanthine dehydrogenase FAD-binding subunit